MIDIEGDEFAENDYGLVVDNSQSTQMLSQQIETLAQAALQNQLLPFSAIMKLYSTASIAEKVKLVEVEEQKMKQQQQEQAQQEQQLQQQQMQMQQEIAAQQMQFEQEKIDKECETRIMVAEINSQAEMAILQLKNHMTEEDKLKEGEYSEADKAALMEKMRQFDAKLQLDKSKLDFEKKKHNDTMNFNNKKLNTIYQ